MYIFTRWLEPRGKTACEKEKELKLITSVRFMGFSNITRDGLGSFFACGSYFGGIELNQKW